MPRPHHPDEISDAFDLYLQFNGERFDLLEQEMRRKGWDAFKKQLLFDKGIGVNYRMGWISKYGWGNALKLKVATAGVVAATSAESLLFEVETLRKKIFIELETRGVGPTAKDLIYQHDKYVNRSIEILAQLEKARDNYANFIFFLQHLLKASTKISPALAAEICQAEDALIEWAEKEFVVEEEKEA